jgi:hypothetical protein
MLSRIRILVELVCLFLHSQKVRALFSLDSVASSTGTAFAGSRGLDDGDLDRSVSFDGADGSFDLLRNLSRNAVHSHGDFGAIRQ